jgi:hypothetical protein
MDIKQIIAWIAFIIFILGAIYFYNISKADANSCVCPQSNWQWQQQNLYDWKNNIARPPQ